MDVRQLRTFCTAARMQSISKAAEALNIGQPTATAHIKKLEQELGTPLFDRMRRPLEPTAAGVSLLQMAQPLVKGMDSLLDGMRFVPKPETIRVAVTRNLVSAQMLRIFKDFRASHPELQLSLISCLRPESLELVEKGDADIALIPGTERNMELKFEEISQYERVLIAPKGHPLGSLSPITLEEIAKWPLILPKAAFTRTLLEDTLERKGLRYAVEIEVEGMDTTKRWVAAGLGISVGPSLSIDPDDARKLEIVSLAHLLPNERLTLAMLRDAPASQSLQQFRSLLLDGLQTSPSFS